MTPLCLTPNCFSRFEEQFFCWVILKECGPEMGFLWDEEERDDLRKRDLSVEEPLSLVSLRGSWCEGPGD